MYHLYTGYTYSLLEGLWTIPSQPVTRTSNTDIDIYLEPQWPLYSWRSTPPKQGLFQPKQWSFGFQVCYVVFFACSCRDDLSNTMAPTGLKRVLCHGNLRLPSRKKNYIRNKKRIARAWIIAQYFVQQLRSTKKTRWVVKRGKKLEFSGAFGMFTWFQSKCITHMLHVWNIYLHLP